MVKKSKRERSEPVEKAGASTDQLNALLEQAQSCADSLAFDEALEHCRAALELDPDNVAALDGMGEACARLSGLPSAWCLLNSHVKRCLLHTHRNSGASYTQCVCSQNSRLCAACV